MIKQIFFYLYLNHEASLFAEPDYVTVDVHSPLCLQALHHGINAHVGACPAHSSATRERVWQRVNSQYMCVSVACSEVVVVEELW